MWLILCVFFSKLVDKIMRSQGLDFLWVEWQPWLEVFVLFEMCYRLLVTEAAPCFRSIFNSQKLSLKGLFYPFLPIYCIQELIASHQNHNLQNQYKPLGMSRLSELVNFISRPQIREDPFWKTVLTSDSRSLFPKHELAKIQLAKCQHNKLRLIMEDLESFLSLPLYAQKVEKASKGNQQRDLGKELETIKNQFEKYQQEKVSNDYQFEVLEVKDKIEYFCTELSKPKIKEELKEIMGKHPKWKQYLNNHLKPQEPLNPLLKEKDKCQLASVIDLSQVDDCLTFGTAGKIIEERVKEEVLQNRLKLMFSQGSEWKAVEDDPYAEEWLNIKQQLERPVEEDGPVEYV